MFDSVKHSVPEVLVCIWKLAVIIIARIDLLAHYSSVPRILFVMHGADPHRTLATTSDVIATDPGDNPTLCYKFATTRNHIRTTRDEITLTLIFFFLSRSRQNWYSCCYRQTIRYKLYAFEETWLCIAFPKGFAHNHCMIKSYDEYCQVMPLEIQPTTQNQTLTISVFVLEKYSKIKAIKSVYILRRYQQIKRDI